MFAYDRDEHLSITLEALARCAGFSGARVTVHCDAPRTPAAAAGVNATRAVARAWTDATGARLIERSENMGFDNIVAGITELCDAAGRVIVIENDIVVSPDFLTFMDRGLERYADESRVFMLGGFVWALQPSPQPFVALPVDFIWGWVAWKSAWDHYDRAAPGREALQSDTALRARYDIEGTHDRWSMPIAAARGAIDTWDVQWS